MAQGNQNKIVLENIYRPTESQLEFIAKVYGKYYKWRNNLSTPWSQFGGKSVRDYIREARDKFNGLVPINPLLNRKKFFSNEFRNSVEQVVLFVSNLAQNPKFYGEEGLDNVLATFLNALLKIIRKGSKWKILDAFHYLQTIVDGTGIVYVSWAPRRRKIRDIKYFDLTTGEIEFEEKDREDDEIQEIWIDPLDFFVPKVWELDIEKQGECIWRRIMTWDDFKRQFGSFQNSKYVVPGVRLSEQSIFAEFLDKTLLSSEKVEIIQYFNSEEDEYGIIANGVFLNPLKTRQRASGVSPLPWNHKQLPFAKTVYKLTSPALFWGASLVQTIKDEVEAFNELIEMSLDRIYKAINPPIITSDPNVPNNLKLEGGKLYVSRGEWKELQMGTLDPNVWNSLTILQGQLSRGVTPMTFPSPPSRQPRSASEILARQQREIQSYQLQKVFYQSLLEQKIWLEIQNALQFLTSEKTERMVGSERYVKTLMAEGVPTPGGYADIELRLVRGEPYLSETLAFESLMRSIQNKKRIEIIEVNVETLKNLKFDVEINFDLENTPELRKTLFLQFVQQIMSLFPDILDKRKVIVRLFEVWNENPADYLSDEIFQSIFFPQPQPQLGQRAPLQGAQVQGYPEQLIQSNLRGPEAGRRGGRRPRSEIIPSLSDIINLGGYNV